MTTGADGPLLLCYDGSEDAKHAIELAAGLLGGAYALVLTVWQPTHGLGSFAWAAGLRTLAAAGAELPRPRPPFGHAAETVVGGYRLLGCFHPSQQNTFTGKLTEPMLDAVFRRARELAGLT